MAIEKLQNNLVNYLSSEIFDSLEKCKDVAVMVCWKTSVGELTRSVKSEKMKRTRVSSQKELQTRVLEG